MRENRNRVNDNYFHLSPKFCFCHSASIPWAALTRGGLRSVPLDLALWEAFLGRLKGFVHEFVDQFVVEA